MYSDRRIRVAVLDLYEGQPNQGMRCVREILQWHAQQNNIDLLYDEFEVRMEKQLPDLSYDVYISTGGPGSPLESEGTEWEIEYFNWLGAVESHNSTAITPDKKHVFFICHSFQLACRYYHIGRVSKRKSTAFGVFPIHMLADGKREPVFSGLQDPFYAVDSRDYQVTEPDLARIHKMGAHILAIEKERPHVPLERAIMAIRFNHHIIGTQFHPEADAAGMSMYLQRDDKKDIVISNHGSKKWHDMIEHLNDPDKIGWTYAHILPNFLNLAIEQILGVAV